MAPRGPLGRAVRSPPASFPGIQLLTNQLLPSAARPARRAPLSWVSLWPPSCLPCTATPQIPSLQRCSISRRLPSLRPFGTKSRLLRLEPTAILTLTSFAPGPSASSHPGTQVWVLSTSCCPRKCPGGGPCCTCRSLVWLLSSSHPFFTCLNCCSFFETQEAFSSFLPSAQLK